MKKIIVIGDIHGRPIWKDIINQENPTKDDLVIFLGDYFDSLDIDGGKILNNFLDIMEYRQNNDNTKCFVGNHDYHYIPGIDEQYTGFNQSWYFQNKVAMETALRHNLLQACHIENNIIFSHAGVSTTWLTKLEYDFKEDLQEFINDFFKYRPKVFEFAGIDAYGDSVQSSPIWIRPHSLKKDAVDGYTQVVGHTVQSSIISEKTYKGKGRRNRSRETLWFVDCLGSEQYLTIEDGKFIAKQL